MADAFENILGQPEVRRFLRSSIKQGIVSHAYLFAGPAGSNKTLAAYAFAQALLCPAKEAGSAGGQCGRCDVCTRVMRKKHPDVRYFCPEGANGYLIEQVRDIVADTALAPIQASRKIYILDRVDLLGSAAANAFLKTLEEPPEDVLLILLGRTCESVLPTIVSRCQVVPFRHIPATEAAGILVQNTGASLERARMALEACDGSITRAADFLKSNERMAFRTRVLDALAAIRLSDDWDILELAADLAQAAQAPLDVVRAVQEQEIAENADFLAKSAIRQIEARNKRALTAKGFESLHQLTAIVRSWLRDVMAICANTPELVINVDVRDALEEASVHTDEARAASALLAVRECDEAIAYNVSPETCLDALLFEVRELLFGAHGQRARR